MVKQRWWLPEQEEFNFTTRDRWNFCHRFCSRDDDPINGDYYFPILNLRITKHFVPLALHDNPTPTLLDALYYPGLSTKAYPSCNFSRKEEIVVRVPRTKSRHYDRCNDRDTAEIQRRDLRSGQISQARRCVSARNGDPVAKHFLQKRDRDTERKREKERVE